MRFLDWLLGRDLEDSKLSQIVFAPEPIIPEREPRKPTNTAERRSRGVRARLELEQTEAAFDHMILNATKNWAESGPGEVEKREEAYRLVHVIHSARIRLRELVADGEMAAAQEQTEERRKAAGQRDNRE